jgi:hypothetical protein
MKLNTYLIFLALSLFSFDATGKEIVGWVEKVILHEGDKLIEINAKNDTGAKTSSLHCQCYNFFERNGQRWVRFTVINFKDEAIVLERKVHRIVTIKRHAGEEYQERPVIKLGICLGSTYKETEINLIDRTGLNYQLLIGRQFLENGILVDSSAQYTREPECNELKNPGNTR